MTNLLAEVRVPCGRRPPEWPRLFGKSDRFVKLRTGAQKMPLSDSFLPRLQVITVNPGKQRFEPSVPGIRSRGCVVRLRRGFSNHERLMVLLGESCDMASCGF